MPKLHNGAEVLVLLHFFYYCRATVQHAQKHHANTKKIRHLQDGEFLFFYALSAEEPADVILGECADARKVNVRVIDLLQRVVQRFGLRE